MKISDIPFKDLKVGMKVKSLNNGVIGKIDQLLLKEDINDREDNIIVIKWRNKNTSYVWHFWCDKVLKI
jgi:hypothetical protein